MRRQSVLESTRKSEPDVIVSCYIPGEPQPGPTDARSDRSGLTGRRIGHYQVIEKVGEGGMGEVYKALDTRLDRSVALKVLARGLGSRIHERRFAREAKAASALNHPNIVTIYEFDTHEGIDFIAMEYVQGTTLNQLMELRTQPAETLIDYARQAAGAIAKAHHAGIVHRDLKPGNIMVTHDGVVKVLDFGLAEQQSATSEADVTQTALTMAGTVVGTPAYMSPEQAKGEHEDWRTDIFSFGVILYEIACGRRPFQGKNAHATLYQITHEEPQPPAHVNPAVPAGLAELIGKCLKKERGDRAQSMDEVAAVLGDLGNAAPVRSTRISRRALWAGALGAAAVAAGVWYPKPAGRILTYSIEARKMRGDEPDGAPFAVSIADAFDGGWRFRLRVRLAKNGFLYVINEGAGEAGSNRLWVLYPAKAPGAALAANGEIVTGWYGFEQNAGAEKLWIVWSERAVDAIEAALGATAGGRVESQDTSGAIQRLLAGMAKGRRTVEADTKVMVGHAGPSETLAELLELKHR